MSDRPSGRPVDRRSASWSRRIFAALTALGVLAAAGCNKEDPAGTTAAETVRLYGSDGNMTGSFGATFKEQTLGTSGIAPLEWYFNKGPVAVGGAAGWT